MKRLLVVLLLLVAFGAACARKGVVRVMGTIAAVSTSSVDVTEKSGKTATVAVNDTTRWIKGLDAVDPTVAKAGDRVVIHAKPADGKLLASEVDIALPKKAK